MLETGDYFSLRAACAWQCLGLAGAAAVAVLPCDSTLGLLACMRLSNATAAYCANGVLLFMASEACTEYLAAYKYAS